MRRTDVFRDIARSLGSLLLKITFGGALLAAVAAFAMGWTWLILTITTPIEWIMQFVVDNTWNRFAEALTRDSSSLGFASKVVVLGGTVLLGFIGFAAKKDHLRLYGYAEVFVGLFLGWQTVSSRFVAQRGAVNTLLILASALAISKGIENIDKANTFWKSAEGLQKLEERERRREKRREFKRWREEREANNPGFGVFW